MSKRIIELPPPKPGTTVAIFLSHQVRGEERYRIRYRANDGREIRATVGTKEAAEAAAAKLKLEAFATRFLGQPERPPQFTFKQLEQLQLRRATGKDTKAHDVSRWKTLLIFFDPTRAITGVLPSDIDGFREWMLARATRLRRTHSHGSINRHLALLRSAYNFAIEEKVATDNPIKKSHFFKEKPRDRIATANELGLLLETKDVELRLAIVLAFETSLRESSICSIERSWVSIERRELSVPDTKNDDPVIVPLSIVAAMALEERLDAIVGDHLFSCSPNTIGKRFARLVAELEIKDLRFHDLRHTAATRMARAGVPIKTIMRIGGWRSIASVMRYLRVDTSDLHAAIARVESHKNT